MVVMWNKDDPQLYTVLVTWRKLVLAQPFVSRPRRVRRAWGVIAMSSHRIAASPRLSALPLSPLPGVLMKL